MDILQDSSPEAIKRAIQELKNDNAICAPTETVYGLMARWNSQPARDQIYALKHRPQDKKLQMLVHSLDQLLAFPLKNKPLVQAIGKAFWPGPLTLIVETENGETIGARVPNHPFVLKLLENLGEPLAATSANLSGTPPASTPQDAVANLNGKPALLIDGGVVTTTDGTASTVASILNGSLAILREGIISQQQLQDILDKLP